MVGAGLVALIQVGVILMWRDDRREPRHRQRKDADRRSPLHGVRLGVAFVAIAMLLALLGELGAELSSVC